MTRAPIRSTLFNLAFLLVTGVLCIAYIPLLALPRPWFLHAVRFWIHCCTVLEICILGLRYEVRGREHLPKDGPFLVAAKHQSPYETFKLQVLFDDPAIILKKELLSIPLWGAYLKKSGVIAIDRSTPEKALRSIESGAIAVAAAGRPVVIFPQGTRVRPDETLAQKPYKAGIARVQEATNLPVIPLALNSGMFWPRGGWFKSPGTVVFEFLPPIPPGQDRKVLMRDLEKKIESASQSLMNEAREGQLKDPSPLKTGVLAAVLLALLAGVYSSAWFKVSEEIPKRYTAALERQGQVPAPLVIGGFPGPILVSTTEQYLRDSSGSLRIENPRARIWPIPFVPFKIETGKITVNSFRWEMPLVLDTAKAKFMYAGSVLRIADSAFRLEDFTGGVTGTIDLKQKPLPKFDLEIALDNHDTLLAALAAAKIIEMRSALFMAAGFNVLRDKDGIVRVPLTQRDRTLYAGPLPVASLPEESLPAPGNPLDPAQ